MAVVSDGGSNNGWKTLKHPSFCRVNNEVLHIYLFTNEGGLPLLGFG
jgi:hypothetical protein